MKKKKILSTGIISGVISCSVAAALMNNITAVEWLPSHFINFSNLKNYLLDYGDDDYSYSDMDINHDNTVNVLDYIRFKKCILSDEELPSGTDITESNTILEVFPGLVSCPAGGFITVRTGPDKNSKSTSIEYPHNGMVFEVIGSEGDWYKITYKISRSALPIEGYIEKEYIYFDRKVDSWQKKYYEIISLKQSVSGTTHFSDSDGYCLYDINHDCIPELFFYSRSNSTDAGYIEIYSVYNDEVISKLYRSASTGLRFIDTDTGCAVLSQMYNGDYEQTVQIENGIFTDGPVLIYHYKDSPEWYEIDGQQVSEEEYQQIRSKYISENSVSPDWSTPDIMLEQLSGEFSDPETIPENTIISSCGLARIKDTAVVKSTPSEDGSDINTLKTDSIIYITEEKNGWCRIIFGQESEHISFAYIPSEKAELISYSGNSNEVYKNIVNDTVQFLKTAGINKSDTHFNYLMKTALTDLDNDNNNELIIRSCPMSGNGPYFSGIFSFKDSVLNAAFIPDDITGIAVNDGIKYISARRSSIYDFISLTENGYHMTAFEQNLSDTVHYINGCYVSGDKYKSVLSGFDTTSDETEWYDLETILKKLG